jgi:Uma2 family endonuclease
MVWTREAAYYPDVVVVCGPAGHDLYETDATWIVEVLSPSTEDKDRREKALAYATLPSLRGYVLADPDNLRLVLGRHDADGGWTWTAYLPGSELVLDAVRIDVDALWKRLESRTSL